MCSEQQCSHPFQLQLHVFRIKASSNKVWESSPAQRCNCWASQRLPLPLPRCRCLSTCDLSFWPLCWLLVWHSQRHIRVGACDRAPCHRHHAAPLLRPCARPPHLHQQRFARVQDVLADSVCLMALTLWLTISAAGPCTAGRRCGYTLVLHKSPYTHRAPHSNVSRQRLGAAICSPQELRSCLDDCVTSSARCLPARQACSRICTDCSTRVAAGVAARTAAAQRHRALRRRVWRVWPRSLCAAWRERDGAGCGLLWAAVQGLLGRSASILQRHADGLGRWAAEVRLLQGWCHCSCWRTAAGEGWAAPRHHCRRCSLVRHSLQAQLLSLPRLVSGHRSRLLSAPPAMCNRTSAIFAGGRCQCLSVRL